MKVQRNSAVFTAVVIVVLIIRGLKTTNKNSLFASFMLKKQFGI
jgi:hypothetical protein